MKQLFIPCEPGEVSDGYHTFNELYEHRNTLFLAVMACCPERAWLSGKHHNGSDFPGWFIAGLDLPTGTITYHMPNCLMGAAVNTGAKILDAGKPWDGHTSGDVLVRLRDWIGTATPGNPEIERIQSGWPANWSSEELAMLGRSFNTPEEVEWAKARIAELERLTAAYRCAIHPDMREAAGGVCDGPSQEGGAS